MPPVLTPDEKAQALFNALNALTGKTLSWTSGGITFVASNPRLLPKGIAVTITASDARGPLPTDNPYQFFNPLVTDANGTRNELAAVRRMASDVVVLRAKQLGWSP